MSINTSIAADRVRPGNDRAPGKFTYTSSASAFQPVRTAPPIGNPQGITYISIRVTSDAHVVFGSNTPVALVAATNSSPLITASDGWQDFTLQPYDTGFIIKGDSAGGDIYWFFS